MRNYIISAILLMLAHAVSGQQYSMDLNNWHYYYPANTKWYAATVPGTIHTDLLNNKLIPNPYYRDNENKLQWIGEKDWTYKTIFSIPKNMLFLKNIELEFDGLDTYADVYLNGQLVLQADNMFRGWTVNVKGQVRDNNNELLIYFHSAQKTVDSIAKKKLPVILPDNPRVYARKAQYHFGWDWGPKFVTCGIWKNIRLNAWNGNKVLPAIKEISPDIKLIQQKDSTGTSFYFEKAGQPVYIKGANWIPADMFVTRLTKADYRKMLLSAKDAHMNMLRVWGGGIYEDDYFYELCDSLGIMVWQDFMFAGGMVPGDEHFLNNVKEEIRYQVGRLRKHPCIVLWCGNNEVDEAWNNWGWQQQFNLHGKDSAKIWNDYKRLFIDSLPQWVNDFDGTRPYIASSPLHGWGHKESFTAGDSHYWGLWWGLEDWETFDNKTGRFVSEYGMQSMPNWNTLLGFTKPADRKMNSPVIQSHQKASDGFKKLNYYLTRYFIDSAKLTSISPEQYTYLTQCMQYYILKNSIAIHRSKYPANMGTLLWQLNDCWPVTSWSITDYSRQPKAAWYAVKEAYRDDVLPTRETTIPKKLKLKKPVWKINLSGTTVSLSSNVFTKYVQLSFIGNDAYFEDNYFDLQPGEEKKIRFSNVGDTKALRSKLRIKSLYDVLNQ